MHFISSLARHAMALTAAASLAFTATSCQDMIYDQEGDCAYYVKFSYDYNMKWADAFPSEVQSITLYLLDDKGNIVWEGYESGDAVMHEGYTMRVDIDPGIYTLVAWGGDEEHNTFSKEDGGRAETLTRRLRFEDNRGDDEQPVYSSPMDRLYHGMVQSHVFKRDYTDNVVTVPLVKNTNDIRIVLQQIKGEPIDPSLFYFTIEDCNSSMSWDNSLNDAQMVTYRPWYKVAGATDMPSVTPGSRDAQLSYSAMIAEFTVTRLMEDNKDTAMLTIKRTDTGETLVRIPLIQALLLVKGYYRDPNVPAGAQWTPLSDQEYLDRKDDYSLTFFLDEGSRWIDSYIYINSWKVVLQNTDI